MIKTLGAPCQKCGFVLYNPIVKFGVSVLGLYDDCRFPGRSLLVYHKHAEFFESLGSLELAAYVSDIKRAVGIIKQVMGVHRVNICVLGNAIPHLHTHLIPRVSVGDPAQGKAPWAHPEQSAPLPGDLKGIIINKIRRQFGKIKKMK